MRRSAAIALAIVCALWAVPAYAMPQAIAGALIFAGLGTVASYLIAYGVTLIAMGLYAKRQRRKAIDAYNKSLRDRNIMIRSGIEPREIVLGRVRKSGPVVFVGTIGEAKEMLVMVIALAAHEIDAVEQVYFNEHAVTIDGSGNVTSSPFVIPRKVGASKSIVMTNGSGATVLDHDPIAGSVHVTYHDTAASGDSVGSSVEASVVVSGRNVTATFTTYPLNSTTVTAAVSYQYYTYDSKAVVRWYLGTDDQVADPTLISQFPGVWTSAHRLRGIAYLIVQMAYDENVYPTSVPNISATIRGAKVYDPRTGTTAWSENPALLARHYATHQLGGRQPTSRVSDTHVIAAANVCDQTVDYPMNTGTVSRALYTAGTVASAGQRPLDVLNDLAEAMGGKIAFANNELIMKAGGYVAPALDLTDDDIGNANEIQIQPRRPRQDLINTVTGTFVDYDHDHLAVDFKPVSPTEYVTADGAVLPMEVELNAVTHAGQAQHVVGIMLRDSRQALTLRAPFKMRAYPVQLFDVVTLTIPRLGFDSKEFEVLDRRWSIDGLVNLTLKETASSIFEFGGNFDAVDVVPNTNLPLPWEVADIEGLTVESGTDQLVRLSDGTLLTRVRVSWDAIVDSPVTEAGVVEITYTPADDPAADGGWARVTVPGSSTEAYILGLEDGRIYLFKARARSTLAAGDWSLQVTHEMLGKSEAPDNVPWALISGSRITWGPVNDIDLAGYRLRYVAGAQINWAAGSPLHDGLITVTSFDMVTRPSGLVTILIKAVDSSGNESTSPAYIVTNLGDPEVLNLLESWPQATAFTGDIVNGTIDAGVLEADETTAFWRQGTGLHWGGATAVYWPTSQYSEMSYTCYFSTTAGGTLFLEQDIEGADIRVEFYRESTLPFWPDDADEFWPDDAAAFWPEGPGWQPWPGSIELFATETIGIRVYTSASTTQGRIVTLTPHLDVPDIDERLDDIVISSAGTRLPVTSDFRFIKNIQLTVQSDGNGGTSARILDKQVDPGPLVQVLDETGAAVNGLVDARIKGY